MLNAYHFLISHWAFFGLFLGDVFWNLFSGAFLVLLVRIFGFGGLNNLEFFTEDLTAGPWRGPVVA